MNETPTALPNSPMSRRPTVYLDSTIPSYLVTERKDSRARTWRRVTVTWWEKARPHFDCHISQVVIEEVQGGKPANAQRRLEVIQGLPFLVVTSHALKVARYY